MEEYRYHRATTNACNMEVPEEPTTNFVHYSGSDHDSCPDPSFQ